MPTYEQNKKSAQKYLSKFEQIIIRSPKEDGLKETIFQHTQTTGEALQTFVVRAINETMRRDKKKAGE